MKYFLRNWIQEVKTLSNDWHYLVMLALGSGLLFGAFHMAETLARINDTLNSSTPVGDLLFTILPAYDLSFVFVFGAFFIGSVGIFYALFFEPRKIPLVLIAFSLFISIRGICISLTHISIPPDSIPPLVGGFGDYFFQNDLFFSGHTGAPFLGALLLWKKKYWRYFFLGSSVIMAFTVLIMRLHYSIDIVGAYFITYGIYHIALAINNAELNRYRENLIRIAQTEWELGKSVIKKIRLGRSQRKFRK
ncbi:MAG: phosphatase PAP2-related protein [Candidatus Peregrinibacteria bacterium]